MTPTTFNKHQISLLFSNLLRTLEGANTAQLTIGPKHMNLLRTLEGANTAQLTIAPKHMSIELFQYKHTECVHLWQQSNSKDHWEAE